MPTVADLSHKLKRFKALQHGIGHNIMNSTVYALISNKNISINTLQSVQKLMLESKEISVSVTEPCPMTTALIRSLTIYIHLRTICFKKAQLVIFL